MSYSKINSKNEIIIYKSPQGPELEVKIGAESIWLSQAQLAQLFLTERSVITKHIKNVFESGELKEKSNVQKMHFASSAKPVKLYSLDTIISVGYRVNSKRATQFRVWATDILKKYLTAGYAINAKKITSGDSQFSELKKTVKFLEKKAASKPLKGQTPDLMNLLSAYARSLSLFGKSGTGKPKKITFKITYQDALNVIKAVKKDLLSRQKIDDTFGREKGGKFKVIIDSLKNTDNLEKLAAGLLYAIAKERPFADGNKRIAAFLFIYLLDRNNHLLQSDGEKKIDDKTLVSLTLLAAASEAKEKETVKKIIVHLLR